MKKRLLIIGIVLVGVLSCQVKQVEIIALNECPQKMDGLSVELSQDENFVQTVKITKDGKLLQELVGDGENPFYQGQSTEFNNSMVYYVDANFDGYTDIFIGNGYDRCYNSILLWNPDKNVYERYGKNGDPSLTNPYFSPSENAIYECGSAGVWDYVYSKSVWKDGKLINQEKLNEIIFDSDFSFDSYNEYNDIKRSKKYALFDSNEKLMLETDEIEDLPTDWAEVVRKENASGSEESEANNPEEEEDIDIDIEPESPYNEQGTLGTMELQRNGQYGDPNFPNCYYGIAGEFKNYYVYKFDCYPYSRFGDDDIASLTWCAYNNETGEEEYSISVPSNVILEGKTYRVERVQLGNWLEDNDAASRYVLPSTIKYINFANLRHLKEVVLSEGIDTISIRAFWGCVDLENVVIPSTVKKIEGLAFNNCPKLKKIRIPASVVDIEEGAAFIGVFKETVIEVEDGCKAFEGLKANNHLIVKGPYGNKSYKFNPEDLNIVYLKSSSTNDNDEVE